MGENVQCPVCTLYLHAGMNLSDHLETHPKEQVIRALVQMTISGVGGGTSTLASVLKESSATSDSKSSVSKPEEESLVNDKSNDLNNISTASNCSASVSNSASNCSLSNQSATSSQNSNNILHFSRAYIEDNSRSDAVAQPKISKKPAETIDEGREIVAKENVTETFSSAHRPYSTSTVELPNVNNNFAVFANPRYHSPQNRNASSQQNQLNATSQMPPPSAPQVQHQDISRTNLPAPPLPQPMSSQTISPGFHTLQTQQLPHPQAPHHSSHLNNVTNGHNRQSHIFAGQHQQPHHQQDIKVIYSSGLPPPPPLQLFSYQPPSQLQHHHQKPPPAYGTAISQIRSQNNNNKNQISGTLTAQQQNSSMPPHHAVLLQQQQINQHQSIHHHHLRIHGAVHSQPPIVTKHLFSKTDDTQEAASSVPPQFTRQSNSHHQNQNKFVLTQQQLNSDVETQAQYNISSNSNEMKAIKGPSAVSPTTTASSQAQVAITSNVASASMAAVAASTLGRHTSSPFAALLAAAAGAPSPSNSSVLRYAESPVAHYLERDNGDFIVQETPKHIVECVEKDNGEFSVIERIYQSPPSVLHIHDEEDADEENNKGDESEEDVKVSKDEKKETQIKSHTKKGVCTTPPWKDDSNQSRTSNKIPNETKKNNSKSKQVGSTLSDSEIVDFVSISGDSDDEEFISHERKDQKNTTEKLKKYESSILPNTSTSSSLVPPSLPSDTDTQGGQVTSHSPSSTSTVANPSCTRKKSSKNTVTVLSDVQLNLNEYLDLVGNIIASSKVAAQRRTFTSIAPIPLVKIEKEEPMDDYAITATNTIEQPPTPLKADKQETEDLTDNSSNKPNNISTVENEEKKPHVLENIQGSECVAISSHSKNSSQVTSVIRMATTSQLHQKHQLQQLIKKSNENGSENSPAHIVNSYTNKISVQAEDLSQQQKKTEPYGMSKTLVGPPSLTRKGPKKLVIKPKSTKKDLLSSTLPNIDDQQPSTSAKALEEYSKLNRTDNNFNEIEIQVKNEPITSITFENCHYHQQAGYSILGQHLTSKEPILECKEEKPCIQESNLSTAIKEMKVEKNVSEDARVLYDFANSKKSESTIKSQEFPSPKSLFSENKSPELRNNLSPARSHIPSKIDSSLCSTSSAKDITNKSEEQSKKSDANTPISSEHNTSQEFSDFSFNYLYNNNNNNVPDQADVKNPQFPSFYQDTSANTNNINPSMVLEDSSSSKNYSDYNKSQHELPSTSSQNQWFSNYQTVEANTQSASSNHSNSNINMTFSADCSTTPEGNAASKYLDLDKCKREQNPDVNVVTASSGRSTIPPPPPPSSSTSCSFPGTTENSMTGICSTAGTLNIRTDEQMPAKGEISEQESNCDIENSWGQPIYSDLSARFFKSTFPGIFQQDNVWNHEEYFTVQDLSASTTSQTVNVTNNRTKSFDFRLPSDENNIAGGHSNNATPMFSTHSNENCNIDVMPSTSAKIRKRRKRSSVDGKSMATNSKRVQPTSTVTSQQFLQGQTDVQTMDYNLQQQEQQPCTSSAFLAGPSNAESAAASLVSALSISHNSQQAQQQQRIRTKVYECGHCNAKYSKLKDRNAHMVDVHNYVRQNRRLVCLTNGIAVPMTDAVAMATTSTVNSSTPMTLDQNTAGITTDFKQGIIKIENENVNRDVSDIEPVNADLRAKTEVVDDNKLSVALVPICATSSNSHIGLDAKPLNFQPLSLSTTTSKLTALYRMLVTFNMTMLKQNQRLSEFDENLIKSSIFFCYICRDNFNSVKLYDAHLTEHPAECFACGKKFHRWKNFSLHLKRHLGWKEFGCTVCDKKFVVRSALVEHMRMHSGLSPLKCKVCGKHFKRYSNLTQHRKRHSKQIIRRKEYVCYCGEVLPSKARFLWHKETHDSKPKCCPHCCDRFVHVNSLRRHIRLAHSDKFDYTEPMECPICKQIFAKASMKAHMATHSTDTQYDCAICNKSFSTKWNLKIHSWVHANRTAKPYKCEHCPKAFVREVDFKNHMNSHKQIKPYTCEVCGCKFIRKYNYMRHRREHHGNKKYTCDLCKKSFHRHYYLIEHRRIHTGERPFQCTICGKSSTTKTNHNKHLKIHHSRDPFTVEV